MPFKENLICRETVFRTNRMVSSLQQLYSARNSEQNLCSWEWGFIQRSCERTRTRYRRGINVHITPMDFKAPKAGMVVFITNKCRRYFRNILLTCQLTNQLVINPVNVNTVRSLWLQPWFNLYLPYIYIFGYITFSLFELVAFLHDFFRFIVVFISDRKLPLLTTKAAWITRTRLGVEVDFNIFQTR